MEKIRKEIADFLWILQAYLRGKVLRQKAYRPQEFEGYTAFVGIPTSVNRMCKLMKWWKVRPMTIEEAKKLVAPYIGAERVSYLSFDVGGNEWKLEDKPLDWGTSSPTFLARK